MNISIVIPMYNAEKYLDECIQSAINQNYDDFEIIIVDDGSTDRSLEIATKWAKKSDKITVISKENGGTASALNVGIANMKGEWFKWLGADDVLLPDCLKILAEHAKNESIMYYADYNRIDDESNLISVFKDKQYEIKYQGAQMYYNFYGNGGTTLISRHAFRVLGGFAEDLPYADDYEFWLRWSLKYRLRMQHIPEVVMNYRVHSESLTGTKNADENIKLVESLLAMYERYLTSDDREYLKQFKVSLKKKLSRKFPIVRRIMRKVKKI